MEIVDESTRERVVRSVLVDGPSTAASLAERLAADPCRRTPPPRPAPRGGDARGARATDDGPPRTRTTGEGLRAHRGGARPLRPGLRRPRRAGHPLPRRDRRGRGSARVRRPPRRQDRAALPRRGQRPSRPRAGPGAGPGLHRRGVRRRGARPATEPHAASRRVSSCASSTARSPTWPTSSPSCARRRPPRSAGCSAATSSAWPRSPTATASARRASRTSTEHQKARHR